MFMFKKSLEMPSAADALKGRATAIATASHHFVNGRPLKPPFPEGLETAIFGLGCFWGAERKFWELGDGIYVTAVGYAGGYTPNPTYEEVCSGRTGHNEVVLVVYDPKKVSYEKLLKTFWESHDPTQGMRQGNDVGTQYRSAIYAFDDAQRYVHVVFDDDVTDVLRQRGEDLNQLGALPWRQAGSRLVEQDEARRAGERQRDLELALLAVREFGDKARLNRRQMHRFD